MHDILAAGSHMSLRRSVFTAALVVSLATPWQSVAALQWPGCTQETLARFPGGWPGNLDWGLHWYTADGRVQKAQKNETSEFFQPGRKTMIYFHGYLGEDGGSTEYCYRPSPYCDPDLCKERSNMLEAWFQQGWNVGFFYWDQFADETCARDAEQKIWFDAGGDGLRWAKYDVQSKQKTYQVYPNTNNVSVGDLCATVLADILDTFSGESLRFVGYDIGSQLAAHCAARLYDKATPWAASKAKPTRITMLDPIFTERHFDIFRCGKVDFQAGVKNLAAKAAVKDMETLWLDHTVPTEVYKSSLFTETSWLSDVNTDLQFLGLLVTYDPDWCNNEYSKILKFYSNWQCRHKASILQYFSSLSDPFMPLANAQLASMEKPGKCYVPSAACSDDDIRKMTRGKERTRMMRQEDMSWDQEGGQTTMQTSDDKFGLIVRRIGSNDAHRLPTPSMENVLDDFLEPSTNDNFGKHANHSAPNASAGSRQAPLAQDRAPVISASPDENTSGDKAPPMSQHRKLLVAGLGVGGFLLLCYGLFPVWRKCCCCCVRKDQSFWAGWFQGDDGTDLEEGDFETDTDGGASQVSRWYSNESQYIGPE
eukprot:TRINITY_DN41802_c0_g2_i1.p1 TRINITY_DN41802_c0_g2~~TRINITY_DN41802_c0_g2_i1.p1  ORF type:complete len:593 (-),score=128.89 TRINITY_DN41802_c0_g2_i1:54-1832(-)